jgi:dihydroorotate dehydrogenase (NAD+) catalytic subunit
MVQQAARAIKIPVIGIGGIASGEDAAEFLIAGASLVEVGTATFMNPAAPLKIARELGRLLPELGVRRACDLVGTAQMPGFA